MGGGTRNTPRSITLYRLIDDGQLPAYKFGRVIRLRRNDVEAFIEASRVEPGSLKHLYPQPREPDSSPSGEDQGDDSDEPS